MVFFLFGLLFKNLNPSVQQFNILFVDLDTFVHLFDIFPCPYIQVFIDFILFF